MRLFANEEINFNPSNNNRTSSIPKEKINEKYVKGEVRIVTEQARYPLDTIVSMVDSGKYNLNPEFQRRHRWDAIRKSKLIESFIMNVPIPPIFLYEVKYSEYEVMDGLQRLTAIYEFYQNKYPLQGLTEWYEINDLYYSDLPSAVKGGIDRRFLSSVILLQETAKNSEEAQRMKQIVFERLNSGGIKLEPQETRNALYDGKLNQLCIKLARNPHFCKMWKIPEPTRDEIRKEIVSAKVIENDLYREMQDVELVLRFFAYRQIERLESSSLKEFLDCFLRNGNLFGKSILDNYEILFKSTIKLVYDTLGEKAFFLWRDRGGKWSWYPRPTKAVYDPLMQVFSKHISNSEKIVSNREQFIEELKAFYATNYEEFGGRNNGKNDVISRIRLLSKFMDKFIRRL